MLYFERYDEAGDQVTSECLTFSEGDDVPVEPRFGPFSRCKVTDRDHNVLLDLTLQ